MFSPKRVSNLGRLTVWVPLDRPALLEVEVTPQTDWTFFFFHKLSFTRTNISWIPILGWIYHHDGMYARKWPCQSICTLSSMSVKNKSGRIRKNCWNQDSLYIAFNIEHQYCTFNSIMCAAIIQESNGGSVLKWCQSNCTKSSYKNVVDVVKKNPFLKKSLFLLEGIL
jgi:hypothetical protein